MSQQEVVEDYDSDSSFETIPDDESQSVSVPSTRSATSLRPSGRKEGRKWAPTRRKSIFQQSDISLKRRTPYRYKVSLRFFELESNVTRRIVHIFSASPLSPLASIYRYYAKI